MLRVPIAALSRTAPSGRLFDARSRYNRLQQFGPFDAGRGDGAAVLGELGGKGFCVDLSLLGGASSAARAAPRRSGSAGSVATGAGGLALSLASAAVVPSATMRRPRPSTRTIA